MLRLRNVERDRTAYEQLWGVEASQNKKFPREKPLSSQTIASYLPDSQLIKLGVDLPAFCDPVNPRGFIGGHELAYVFHEWTHYLHNVSTIHGLSAFANLIHLWSGFRKTIGPDGFSMGSSANPEEIRMHFRQKNTFTQTTRNRRPNAIPGKFSEEFVTVTALSERSHALPGLDIETRVIVCALSIRNAQGDNYTASVEIGSHEIVESVAYVLEARCTVRAGGKPIEVPFAPYRLLTMLANHVAPHLTEELVIACGIASLQNSDPPSSLLHELVFAEAEKLKGGDVFAVLEERQRQELHKASAWIEEQLKVIEDIFPVEEPMARAVKKTVSTMRSNFEARKQLPFFELAIIENIIQCKGNLTPIFSAFGACGIFQQCPGFDDDLQRDRLYEFVLDDEKNSSLDIGRRLMHAAFDFIRLHSSKGEIVPTLELPKTRRNMCPFYTVCGLETRRDSPQVCAEEPWLTAHRATTDLCWYGQAVRLISPPEVAEELEKQYPAT